MSEESNKLNDGIVDHIFKTRGKKVYNRTPPRQFSTVKLSDSMTNKIKGNPQMTRRTPAEQFCNAQKAKYNVELES